MNAAGLLFDSSFHFLDHLAPFCALMKWPLILCDPLIADAARSFYPSLEIVEESVLGLNRRLNQTFSHLVICSPRARLEAALGPFEPSILWLPHGNSDKGWSSHSFRGLQKEDLLLIYGSRMAEALRIQNPAFPQDNLRIAGQFRKLYYETIGRAQPLSLFEKRQTTILYAPTWEDAEQSCSFWDAFPVLAKTLPSSLNLLVKPHPNTIAEKSAFLERLIGQTERGNLRFLMDLPSIFPILEISDAYLGDFSSIGYDFLAFNRPMYFLDPPQTSAAGLGKRLHLCGRSVLPQNFFYTFEASFEGDKVFFDLQRQAAFQSAFAPCPKDFSNPAWIFS